MYSALINKRIAQYCNEINIFTEEQNGFCPKRSCEDHVFSLSSVIQNRLNNGKDTFCAFIDLEKAFDWLNRDLLLHKLLSININGNMYFAIKSLLQNTKSKVSLSETVSTSLFDVTCGVRQGDPLSPTLFSLFINDLVDDLEQTGTTLCVGNVNFNTLLYADDMVIIGESELDLQVLLNALNDWCFKWRVKINQQKSKIIHFRKVNSKQTEIDFKLNEVILEKVSSYKYLGIILDDNLKFDLCIKALADSAGRALGATINKFKLLKNVGYETFTKLFRCGVTSVMEYGSSIWGFKKAPEIDMIQNRAMHYFLGVHKYTPIAGMLGDMGWYQQSIGRKLCILRLWNRIIQTEDNRLTKVLFNADYVDAITIGLQKQVVYLQN